MESLYLAHHGVKGQQWGVRHGPPYPLDGTGDITIKKGTKFQRLTIRDETVKSGHDYVTYLKGDSQHYRGFFAAKLSGQSAGKDVYALKLEAKEDLKSPSKNERVKTFLEMYKYDPILAKELGSYYKDDWHNFTPWPRKLYEYKFSKLDGQALREKGYPTFVRAIGGNQYIRDSYFSKLRDKGYNFVIDDCDANKFGKEPAIVFDRNASLSYKGREVVPKNEIYDTWRKEGTRLK